MTGMYLVETFDASALDELGSDGGSEFEQRLNDLAAEGWKVVTMTSDDQGYVVILQRTRPPRKRVTNSGAQLELTPT
jgi:hypothetical protein